VNVPDDLFYKVILSSLSVTSAIGTTAVVSIMRRMRRLEQQMAVVLVVLKMKRPTDFDALELD
jgi:hypothetical protein